MIPESVDVLIVGAGPAGTAAALTFARYTDLAVLLVDRRAEPGLALGELVSPGVLPLLEFVGAAEALAGDGHLPAQGVAAAWSGPDPVPRDFFFSARGHGWHLDRRRFNRRMAAMAEAAGVATLFESRVADIEPAPDAGWRVALSTGSTTRPVAARFLIDAGGRAAGLARRLGARATAADGLVGIAGFCTRAPASGGETGSGETGSGETEDESDPWPATTLIEATADGWWYTAPLPDGRLVATLMTDADLVRSAGYHRLSTWQTALERAHLTAGRVDRFALVDPPMVRAAHSQVLEPAAGPGWIAAGDAAAAFDPLSGLGIGHALSSGIHAARAAEAALRGDTALIDQYADGVAANAAAYRRTLAATYGAVRRFPDAPFWARRNPAASAAGPGAPGPGAPGQGAPGPDAPGHGA
ncbi:MAG: FAD-dependent oxidoreductase [Alphaproteobacteria bacterium]|jgi:flavin-dependent dehydrogenase|nr:FAD-dependent oxidoreductase [Alphaproteobacteria bacterium]